MVLRYRRNARRRKRRFRRTIGRKSRRATSTFRRRANTTRIQPRRNIMPQNLGRSLITGGQMKMIHQTKLTLPYIFTSDTDTEVPVGGIVVAKLAPNSVVHPFGPDKVWGDFQLGVSGSTSPSTEFSGEVTQKNVGRFADSFNKFSLPWAKIVIRVTNHETFPIVFSVNKYAATDTNSTNDFGGVTPTVNQPGWTAFNLPNTKRYRIGAFNAAKSERMYTKTITIYCPMHADFKRLSPNIQRHTFVGDTSTNPGLAADNALAYDVYIFAQPALATDQLTSGTDPPATDYVYPLVILQAEMTQCVMYQDPL